MSSSSSSLDVLARAAAHTRQAPQWHTTIPRSPGLLSAFMRKPTPLISHESSSSSSSSTKPIPSMFVAIQDDGDDGDGDGDYTHLNTTSTRRSDSPHSTATTPHVGMFGMSPTSGSATTPLHKALYLMHDKSLAERQFDLTTIVDEICASSNTSSSSNNLSTAPSSSSSKDEEVTATATVQTKDECIAEISSYIEEATKQQVQNQPHWFSSPLYQYRVQQEQQQHSCMSLPVYGHVHTLVTYPSNLQPDQVTAANNTLLQLAEAVKEMPVITLRRNSEWQHEWYYMYPHLQGSIQVGQSIKFAFEMHAGVWMLLLYGIILGTRIGPNTTTERIQIEMLKDVPSSFSMGIEMPLCSELRQAIRRMAYEGFNFTCFSDGVVYPIRPLV